MSLTLGVRTVSEQEQNSLVAKIGKATEIRHLPIYRRIVELEVARMDDHSYRGLDRKSYRIRDGVIHSNKPDAEAPDIDDVTSHNGVQIRRVHPVLLQTSLQYA